MSIPPNSPWRGAAAFLPQPVHELEAQNLVKTIYNFNVSHGNLQDIEYRSSDGDMDVMHHVFRWDVAQYDFVFEHGFQARRRGRGTADETPDSTYYSLESYVNDNGGGRPLDSRRDAAHAFISTTMSSSWTPPVAVDHGSPPEVVVYRYEIYAPGGILVAQTLGDLYRFRAQDEVAFPAGIAPQYIRSAQRFQLTNDESGNTRRKRVDNVLFANINFNPLSHPTTTLGLRRPVFDYLDEDTRERRSLTLRFIGRRPADHTSDEMNNYYFSAERVGGIDHYIDAAFRSTRWNEAYMFIQGEYVLMDYAPGSTDDKILNGPHFTGDSFPSLVGTAFAEHGIYAAFGCHGAKNEAVIFSGNLCAKINYAPGTTGDFIIEGPKTIKQMFPFFKGTSFEKGIDAAFESTRDGEAYLFKGSEYALIDYDKRTLVAAIRPITDGFPCLRCSGGEFERDIGAAFASHVHDEAYLFKGNSYILLHFTPGETKDYIVHGPREIIPESWLTFGSWTSFKNILPRKNRGLDVYEFAQQKPGRDHDK